MTIHKLTAGDGYTYLTRHVAGGDLPRERGQDAAEYYTVEGNPPGQWIGRGAHLLGLGDGPVTETQMKALFGLGMHPDADRIIEEFLRRHTRAGMTTAQLDELRAAANSQALLGRPFPQYQALDPFEDRVNARLHAIAEQIGREPNSTEISKVRREEARKQRAAVAGYDVVFAPVKSAAVLWALDERSWVRDAVMAAHNEAKASAIGMLEQHAAFTRTGTGGVAQIATHGLIAASFDHYDSRSGDPNLHTHVAISNKVCGADGKWRSLDGRALYRIVVAASEHYNTAFEVALSSRLGVQFTSQPATAGSKEPVREIDGIPTELVDFFSHRRTQIEARYEQLLQQYRERHGHEPGLAAAHRLARQANLETREGKKAARSLSEMRAKWLHQVRTSLGSQPLNDLARVGGRRREAPDEPDIATAAQTVTMTVAAARSTWTIWNLRAEAERYLRFHHSFDSVQAQRNAAEAIVARALAEYCLCVEAPSLTSEPDTLRRSDGASVFTEHGAQRYTSHHVLDAEERLLAAAQSQTGHGLSAARAETALRSLGLMLDESQRRLVLGFATDGNRLAAGIGPAGSGKTTAMRAFRQLLELNGRRLIALATSSSAAKVLETELGIPADNLHKFLHDLRALGPDQRMAGRVRAGDVILVDEAGMAGTFNLDQLVLFASQRGALVRLLGDPQQLGAVESGGALRLIVNDTGAYELSNLHRFAEPAEAQATLQLRDGDSAALDFYETHGRIHGGSRQAMADAAYSGWRTDMLAGKLTLMTAATNNTVTVLSARARAERVESGQVEHAGAGLHDGNVAGVGDWIVTRQNRRTLTVNGGLDFVKNGDGWRVVHRYPDGSLRAQHLTHGGYVVLPAAYVATHVELLYAVTTNRAQGSTVGTAHAVISNEMARENLYVAATRARNHTTLYVVTHELLPLDEDERLDRQRFDTQAIAAREVLETVLHREQAEKSATETMRHNQNKAESLSVLVPRLRQTIDSLDTEDGTPRHSLLPWLSVPTMPIEFAESRYAAAVAQQVRARTEELAKFAASSRPAWTTVFGDEPAQPAERAQWWQAMWVVAAFRDQYEVRDNHPERPLGAYIDEGHAGHRAYWYAAEAIIGLRNGFDGPAKSSRAGAAFQTLAPQERAIVLAALAQRLGPLWFGTSDHDATRQIYDNHLADVLTARGHIQEPPLSKWREVDPRLERIRAAREAERAAYRARLKHTQPQRIHRADVLPVKSRPKAPETQVAGRPYEERPAAGPEPRP